MAGANIDILGYNDSGYEFESGMSTNNTTIFEELVCEDNAECMEFRRFESIVKVVVPIFFGLIFITGVVGNLLVVIVVVSNKQMRNTTNLLIINLALADLLFIIICVPFTATLYTFPRWLFGELWCKIYQYMVYVTAYASVYTLVCMSLDRYLAVVHPIQSMTIRTERNAYIVIALMWFLVCGSNIPVAFDHGIYYYPGSNETRSACIFVEFLSIRSQIYYACFFTFAFVVPLATVCILYAIMLNRLITRVGRRSSQSSESMRSKKRVTYMVITVVVFFTVCWIPIQIIFLMTNVFHNYPDSRHFMAFKIFSTCFAYMNSCVNPFLYAFLSENFRKSFRKILCCTQQFQPVRLDIERTQIRGSEPLTRTTVLNGNSSSETKSLKTDNEHKENNHKNVNNSPKEENCLKSENYQKDDSSMNDDHMDEENCIHDDDCINDAEL